MRGCWRRSKPRFCETTASWRLIEQAPLCPLDATGCGRVSGAARCFCGCGEGSAPGFDGSTASSSMRYCLSDGCCGNRCRRRLRSAVVSPALTARQRWRQSRRCRPLRPAACNEMGAAAASAAWSEPRSSIQSFQARRRKRQRSAADWVGKGQWRLPLPRPAATAQVPLVVAAH